MPPTKRSRPTGGGAGKPPASPDTAQDKGEDGSKAFDIWLDRGLHELYDKFAQEPIPDALKAIIDADRAKKP